MKTRSAEEVKKKYIKRIEKNMKENLFMESLEKLQMKYKDWLRKGYLKKESESTIEAA